MNHDLKNTLTNGLVGVGSVATSTVVSLSTVNTILQTVSLSLGGLIAAITLYRLVKNKPKP